MLSRRCGRRLRGVLRLIIRGQNFVMHRGDVYPLLGWLSSSRRAGIFGTLNDADDVHAQSLFDVLTRILITLEKGILAVFPVHDFL